MFNGREKVQKKKKFMPLKMAHAKIGHRLIHSLNTPEGRLLIAYETNEVSKQNTLRSGSFKNLHKVFQQKKRRNNNNNNNLPVGQIPAVF